MQTRTLSGRTDNVVIPYLGRVYARVRTSEKKKGRIFLLDHGSFKMFWSWALFGQVILPVSVLTPLHDPASNTIQKTSVLKNYVHPLMGNGERTWSQARRPVLWLKASSREISCAETKNIPRGNHVAARCALCVLRMASSMKFTSFS